jgi:hypothetical protein
MDGEVALGSMKGMLAMMVFLWLLCSCAFADPIEFGYVNDKNVALRR